MDTPAADQGGKMSPPRAMIVTPEAPLNAVKTAVANTATTARPPGTHPNIACASANESPRRLAFREHISGECEQRDRDQRGKSARR